MSAPGTPVFGRVLTAMVTPFAADGALDLDGAARLAAHLVEQGNDGLVVNGTTGEAATTSDAEKSELVRAVVGAVGARCHVVAGVGTNDTAHSVELARQADKAGAHGLLLVTPYYNKPPQAGVLAHCERVASATELPMMLYDIPGRSAIEMTTATLVQLAAHPSIVALKDAKLDLEATSQVLRSAELDVYSGQDGWTLPLLAVGAVGVVGTSTHLTAGPTRELVESFLAGDVARARAVHTRMLPAFTGVFRTQGTILVKAALNVLGLPAGPVRLPLVDATPEQVAVLRADLEQAGLSLRPA